MKQRESAHSGNLIHLHFLSFTTADIFTAAERRELSPLWALKRLNPGRGFYMFVRVQAGQPAEDARLSATHRFKVVHQMEQQLTDLFL